MPHHCRLAQPTDRALIERSTWSQSPAGIVRMGHIRLTTLGSTDLTGVDGGAVLSVLAQPKRFALLVYLAVEGSNGLIRRDSVAALFWPERDQVDARANLRKSIYFLKKSLGQDVVLTRGDEEVGIDPGLLKCDVVTLLAGDDVPAEGPFLNGFHFSGAPVAWEEWLDDVQARVRARVPALAVAVSEPLPHGLAFAHVPVEAMAVPAAGSDPVARWRRMTIGAFALALVLAAGFGWALLRDTGGHTATGYHRIRLGSGAQYPGGVHRNYALPPDGSGILYRDSVDGRQGSWWKPLAGLEPTYLGGLDAAVAPVFSPDGVWVAFARDGELRKQRVTGESSVVLVNSISDDYSPGLAWLPGGDVLFEDEDHNLMSVDEGGGVPRLVAAADEVGEVFHVSGMAGGGGLLVTGCNGWCDSSVPRLSYVDLQRNTVIPLRDGVWMAWPMSDGRVVTVDGQGTVSASLFDPGTGNLGQPIPLLDGVALSPIPDIVMGLDGSLLYVRGEVDPFGQRLVWVDREGHSELVDPDWPPTWRIRSLALSPDDRRLAVGIISGLDSFGEQLWIKDLPGGAFSALTEGPSRARRPVWSSDGSTIAFITQFLQENSAWFSFVSTIAADGSASGPELLLRHEEIIMEVALSDDSKTAVVRTGDSGADHGDIAFVPLAAVNRWQFLSESEADEYGIALSPDGRWLAYTSEESGRPEVWVRPVPGPGPRVKVSRDGAVEPRWAHDGSEIFFRTLRPGEDFGEDTRFMVAASVNTDSKFRVESLQSLFGTSGYLRGPHIALYDVAADDQRFLMVTNYGPRRWQQGEAIYSTAWYWSDDVQERLRR